jgi:Putative Actinobacterial Holin-X, holin superfamily III
VSEYTPSEEKAATTSLGDLFKDVTKDMSTLIRQEVALAKAEISDSAKKAGKGAGMLGGAGYAAIMVIFFLSLALMWALASLIGPGWGALIVAVVWAVIALVLFLQGRKQLKTVRGAPETVGTVKQIPETLKRNEENR